MNDPVIQIKNNTLVSWSQLRFIRSNTACISPNISSDDHQLVDGFYCPLFNWSDHMSLRLFKVTAAERINDGKLNHPQHWPRGKYHRDEEDVDDDLGDGEDGDGHHEDDGDGLRWRGGGQEE